MKKYRLAMLLSSAVALSSLSGISVFAEEDDFPEPPPAGYEAPSDQSADTAADVQQDISYDEESVDDLNAITDAYEQLISNIRNLDWGEFDYPYNVYQYALVQFADTDHPQLLLNSMQMSGYEKIKIVDWNDQTGATEYVDYDLEIGVGGAGGVRIWLYQNTQAPGLRYQITHSMNPDVDQYDLTLVDGTVLESMQWTGVNGDYDQPSQAGFEDVQWYDVSDLSGAEKLREGTWSVIAENTAENASTPENTSASSSVQEYVSADPAAEEWKQARMSDGFQVFPGTYRYVTYEECLQIQGIADPNPGASAQQPYIMLFIPDYPVEVTAKDADGNLVTRTVTIIRTMADRDACYDGDHMYIGLKPEWTFWRPENEIPVGAPKSGDDICYFA